VLAAKCSLSIRVDALGEHTDATVGLEGRAKVRGLGLPVKGRACRAWTPCMPGCM